MTSPIGASFDAFCDAEGITVDQFRSVMSAAARSDESPFAKVETGEISEDEFDREVAKLLSSACGKTIDGAGLKRRMFAMVVPDDAMWNAVRAAHDAGIKTALLSNSWGGRDYPIEQLEEIFDEIVISGEVGLRKPEPEIYRYTADRLGVPAETCVFIDDFSVNVEGADAVGMTGMLHRDPRETIARLGDLFDLDLASPADARSTQR